MTIFETVTVSQEICEFCLDENNLRTTIDKEIVERDSRYNPERPYWRDEALRQVIASVWDKYKVKCILFNLSDHVELAICEEHLTQIKGML